MIIIVVGNPLDGIKIIGPFNDNEAAMGFVDQHLPDEDWWIGQLLLPHADYAP